MQLAFRKAFKGDWLDWLIGICTLSKYSHVELVFYDGMSFSSTAKDGVRFAKIEFDDKWDVLDYPVLPIYESVMRDFAEAQNGKKYDWMGIVGFVIPIHEDRKRWFCTEVIVAAFQRVGLFAKLTPPSRVIPIRLYKAARKVLGL